MPAFTQNQLLNSQAINTAEALGLAARFIVEGYMSGEHKSPFRGFSIEFTQHREYVPGDDIRHLDWKVLGRTDRYYLKQYEQETNFIATVVLDASASMRYSSREYASKLRLERGVKTASLSKLQYGKVLAACLAYVVLNQRDAISLALFDTAVRTHLPRTGNLGGIHDILQTLHTYDPTGQTGIGAVLHDLAGRQTRKGIVILISDLFDDEQQILDGIQHLRFGGHEVIVFHVLDPFELSFPFQGLVQFDGIELPEEIKTRPMEVRKTYLKQIGDFQRRMIEGCERNSVHYVLCNTIRPIHEVLGGYLAFRQKSHR